MHGADGMRIPIWAYRLAVLGMATFCSVMIGIAVLCGTGWVDTKFNQINARLASIETNTDDLPVIKDHVKTLWKHAGLP